MLEGYSKVYVRYDRVAFVFNFLYGVHGKPNRTWKTLLIKKVSDLTPTDWNYISYFNGSTFAIIVSIIIAVDSEPMTSKIIVKYEILAPLRSLAQRSK